MASKATSAKRCCPIQKYAHASSIYFQGEATAKEIVLKLEEDDVGFDVSASVLVSGLIGMTERVYGLGGKLNISSVPHQGTKILAVIP